MTLANAGKKEAHIPGQKFEPKYDKDLGELSILELKQYIMTWNNKRKDKVKALGMELHESEFNLGEIAGYALEIISGKQMSEILLEKENFVTAQMFIEDYSKKRLEKTVGEEPFKWQTAA